MAIPWVTLLALVHGGRQTLLYNHVPKCGGSAIKSVLRSVVRPQHLRVVHEFQGSGRAEQETAFVISSLRDPCSYYVSLFAYSVTKKGRYANVMSRVLGRNPQLGKLVGDMQAGGPNNITAFNQFLELSAGCMTMRTFYSLPGLAVDCWVRLTHVRNDLEVCLAAFLRQGGAQALEPSWKHRFREAFDRKNGSAQGGHRNRSPHLPCMEYYSQRNVDFVRHADRSLCAVLGGADCHCCRDLDPGVVAKKVDVSELRVPTVPLHARPDVCWRSDRAYVSGISGHLEAAQLGLDSAPIPTTTWLWRWLAFWNR